MNEYKKIRERFKRTDKMLKEFEKKKRITFGWKIKKTQNLVMPWNKDSQFSLNT